MTQYAEEPTIPNRVTLETLSGEEWMPHTATIANLTRHEVWIGIDEPLGELLHPERRVRLILSRPSGETQTAETIVLWHIGSDGRVIANLWDPPSRRAHSRARLAIPIDLYPTQDAPSVPAQTTNVGVGGLYCLSDQAVPVGKKIPISLWLTPIESFDCRAEVVRVDSDTEDPSGRQVVIALQFLELSENDQARLASSFAALAEDVDENYVPLSWRTAEVSAKSDA